MSTDTVSRSLTEADSEEKFLLTVHGVWSENAGLGKLRKHCKESVPGLTVDSYYYGCVQPRSTLNKKGLKFVVPGVKDKIENFYNRRVRAKRGKLYIVAHSFGTLAVVKALEAHVDAKIEGLVLLGSVIDRDQQWDGFVDDGTLAHPPLAVIRPFDVTVRLGRRVGGEASGARGFISRGIHETLQTYKIGGHTSYYPADCIEVVTAIRKGVRGVPLTSREQWEQGLPGWKRLWLRVLNVRNPSG